MKEVTHVKVAIISELEDVSTYFNVTVRIISQTLTDTDMGKSRYFFSVIISSNHG